jgi:arylsulfatase A-like enzyme
MDRNRLFTIVATYLGLLLSTSFADALQNPFKKNVVFIMAESLRIADADEKWLDAPNIKKFQQQSFTFRNAYSQVGQVGPSRNSILTGRYPQTTLSYNLNDGYRTQIDYKWQTLPGYFRNVLNYSQVTVGGR